MHFVFSSLPTLHSHRYTPAQLATIHASRRGTHPTYNMDDVVANFTVLELEYEGGPVNEKSPNSPEYTYVASAINIALAMLESEQGRDALVDLTVELDNIRPLTLGGPYCHGNVTTSRALDNIFLGKIRAAFPPVVINHTMTNIDVLGTTLSPPWNGSPEDFNPKASMIYLNGSVVTSRLSLSHSLTTDKIPASVRHGGCCQSGQRTAISNVSVPFCYNTPPRGRWAHADVLPFEWPSPNPGAYYRTWVRRPPARGVRTVA